MTSNLTMLQVLGWPYGEPAPEDSPPTAGPSNKRYASPLADSPQKKRPTIVRSKSTAADKMVDAIAA